MFSIELKRKIPRLNLKGSHHFCGVSSMNMCRMCGGNESLYEKRE